MYDAYRYVSQGGSIWNGQRFVYHLKPPSVAGETCFGPRRVNDLTHPKRCDLLLASVCACSAIARQRGFVYVGKP